MKIGIVVVGLAIGSTLLFGSAPHAAESNASVPVAAAPIALVPEAYTALSAPVGGTFIARHGALRVSQYCDRYSGASPSVDSRLPPPPAPAIAAESRAVPPPVAKFNQYHPHWVVALH